MPPFRVAHTEKESLDLSPISVKGVPFEFLLRQHFQFLRVLHVVVIQRFALAPFFTKLAFYLRAVLIIANGFYLQLRIRCQLEFQIIILDDIITEPVFYRFSLYVMRLAYIQVSVYIKKTVSPYSFFK